MKKTLLALSLLVAATAANAAFIGPGASTIQTVSHAMMASDDSVVELTGQISQSLGNEQYLFKDNTGEMQIEIEHDDWHGLTVNPQHTVIIRGEVDNEWGSTQIDVDSIRLQP
ncbi:NirD/YgiW/YdeI family stress tolerance protein [Photobacterium japonica]|uniref:YgiW/YdeI family stress tolerance OB fold protein n=1 Tax=Photobacterium japonica TaxID=2910235 RepID=UPI003D101D36